MKFLMAGLCLFLLSCATIKSRNAIQDQSNLSLKLDLQANQRQIAEDEYSVSAKVFSDYFGKKTFIERLQTLQSLGHQVSVEMERKGDSRKRVIAKFMIDLDSEIQSIEKLDASQNSVLSWIPSGNDASFNEKMSSLNAIANSARVMGQLEDYLKSTQVMEDLISNQNIYYRYFKAALNFIDHELLQSNLWNGRDLPQTKLRYANYLASEARLNLRKVIDQKNKYSTAVDALFVKIENVKSVDEAKLLQVRSPEVNFARVQLRNAELAGASDIDGVQAGMDARVATYFGLEMIQLLYAQLN